MIVQKLDDRVPDPTRTHPTDAGLDLCAWPLYRYGAWESLTLEPGERVTVGTGIRVWLPKRTVGLVCPRSGRAAKEGLSIVNAPGIIDEGYHGEIKVSLINLDNTYPIYIELGDRIAQLVVLEDFRPVPMIYGPDADLSMYDTNDTRGENGHGSSGRR